MICENCGLKNNNDANFCGNCGTQFSNYNEDRRKNYRKNRNRYKTRKREQVVSIKSLWLAALLVIAGFFIYSIIDTNSSRIYNPAQSANDFSSGNPVVEAKVYEIASNFVCGCGSCGEESLEVCSCNFAIQEKKFIRNYVESSADLKTIIFAVNDKYGGLKSDVSVDKLMKSSTFNVPESNKKLVATFNDRIKIYSQFECPCGQCGVDELKDCTCNHKNGATEVKSYIDSEITLNLYSVDEIVSQVEAKYGGKKL